MLAVSGCMNLNRGMDAMSTALVEQAVEYCATKQYRRDALYILVNGALEPHNIEVGVICPSDSQASSQ